MFFLPAYVYTSAFFTDISHEPLNMFDETGRKFIYHWLTFRVNSVDISLHNNGSNAVSFADNKLKGCGSS